MEKFSDIVTAIQNQQSVNPPDALVDQVMARLEKIDQNAFCKIKNFLFHPQTISPDTTGIFSGRIVSYQQCAFLLFMVGFFYLIAGSVAFWGLHDTLAEANINAWLKIQLYITIVSALIILSAAAIIFYHPQTMTFIQYVLILHTGFVLVNAFILEAILSFPTALNYVLVITMLAIVFGVLLIGSIRSVLRFRMFHEGEHCA